MKEPINIEIIEYSWDCADGCCTHYGTKTIVNGVELKNTNQDTTNIVKQILEYLGYNNVTIISKYE